uniref:Protein-arginine deiminase (PAD) N-terminal domain-containing protein n=1 Tax=Piliocolobus tephrosceles TaxID=591936 RepID=A0A8C9LNU3_9PRIM
MGKGVLVRVLQRDRIIQAPPHCILCFPICLIYSSAPEDCTSFSVSASPGVIVDIAHSPPAKKKSTGSSTWPLDPGVEVTLTMKAASGSTGDQKVSVIAVGWQCGCISAGQPLALCPAVIHSTNLAEPLSLWKSLWWLLPAIVSAGTIMYGCRGFVEVRV